MFKSQSINTLIPESAFMSIETFNSKEVKSKILNEDAHKTTVRTALTAIIKEKLKEQKRDH